MRPQIAYSSTVSSYVQLVLGLRSLAFKTVVFVVLAGIFAWFVGGSIFPGSQVVNWPSFQWREDEWHLQVTGNGNHPAPIQWRLWREGASGSKSVETLGIPGIWREVRGPLIQTDLVTFGVESEVDGKIACWIAQINADGIITQRQMSDETEMSGTMRGAGSLVSPAP